MQIDLNLSGLSHPYCYRSWPSAVLVWENAGTDDQGYAAHPAETWKILTSYSLYRHNRASVPGAR